MFCEKTNFFCILDKNFLKKAAVSCFISGRDYERSFGSLFCFGWEYVKCGVCVAQSSVHCEVCQNLRRALCTGIPAKDCSKLCVLCSTELGCTQWFRAALCIRCCTELCPGCLSQGDFARRACVAGFLPGLAKLCVLCGCPNLNGALCFVEPAGICRKLCAFSCS